MNQIPKLERLRSRNENRTNEKLNTQDQLNWNDESIGYLVELLILICFSRFSQGFPCFERVNLCRLKFLMIN